MPFFENQIISLKNWVHSNTHCHKGIFINVIIQIFSMMMLYGFESPSNKRHSVWTLLNVTFVIDNKKTLIISAQYTMFLYQLIKHGKISNFIVWFYTSLFYKKKIKAIFFLVYLYNVQHKISFLLFNISFSITLSNYA